MDMELENWTNVFHYLLDWPNNQNLDSPYLFGNKTGIIPNSMGAHFQNLQLKNLVFKIVLCKQIIKFHIKMANDFYMIWK